MRRIHIILICIVGLFSNCSTKHAGESPGRIHVLFDSDTNNELDDQHALAYLLLNGDAFHVEGITVNRTYNGGPVEKHYEEAERVVKLCNLHPQVKVTIGADGSFDEIKNHIHESEFDGYQAVNLIIENAHSATDEKLVLLPVGKLTNIALALLKDSTIIPKVRIVWLGSNYPDPGEYNQDNDENSLNYILSTDVEFEMVTVRYGKPSGTAAVTASIDEIKQRMPGLGPKIPEAVVGRHNEKHTSFGNYSISLFKHAQLYGEHQVRSLFDMAAVAIVKNPAWAKPKTISAPILVDSRWQERPENPRKIVVWENFDQEGIMADFYHTMEHFKLVNKSED